MVNVRDSDIAVSEFETQLRYYVPFWTNTPGKGINFLYGGARGVMVIGGHDDTSSNPGRD